LEEDSGALRERKEATVEQGYARPISSATCCTIRRCDEQSGVRDCRIEPIAVVGVLGDTCEFGERRPDAVEELDPRVVRAGRAAPE
jgi:hypothetical protein